MLHEYVLGVVCTLVCLGMAWIGAEAKKIAEKWLDTEEKRKAAKTSVLYVQQLYKDFAGPEKMNRALEIARELLEAKGIPFSRDEMAVMMEAAIAEFKGAFFQPETVLTGIGVYPEDDPAQTENGETEKSEY